MGNAGNVGLILEDEQGLFIRHGTSKYRPTTPSKGLRKGQTVKAWPWSGGIKVETATGSTVWSKDA